MSPAKNLYILCTNDNSTRLAQERLTLIATWLECCLIASRYSYALHSQIGFHNDP